MKLKTKIVSSAAVLAFLSLAINSLQAQVTNLVSITATVLIQGSVNDNGTNTTAAAPSKHSVTTQTLLGLLAQDEYAEGNYGSTNFPTGAKLVVIDSHNNNPAFQVLTSGNVLLVDVSDILAGISEDNDVYSGKQNDSTGLSNPSTTDLSVFKFKFDDTGITGGQGVQFYLQGLMTNTKADTIPVNGVYTQTESHKMSGAGQGTFQGVSFVLTGSLSASGKATLTLVP